MTELRKPRTRTAKVRLTEEEARWLKDVADLEHLSVSQVIRLALRDYYRAKVQS